jgi:hypothetical protein
MPLQFTENRQRSSGLSLRSSDRTVGLKVSTNPRTVLASNGIVEATEAESEAGAIQHRYISPLRLAQVLADRRFITPTVKYMVDDYGAVADGTTDNTTAFNNAIADANASSGKMVFVVPVGTCLVTTLNAITKDDIFFIGEGTVGACEIKSTTAAGTGVFKWSTTSTAVDGGGMFDVTLVGSGAATQVFLGMPFAARMEFEVNLFNIGSLASLGDATSNTNTQGVTFGS